MSRETRDPGAGETAPPTCRVGRWWRPCRGPAIGACVYCSRAFCARHGRDLPDGESVCARPRCQRKRADLQDHLRWRERALQRASARRCGIEGCPEEPEGQCSKCQAIFCALHLRDRTIVHREWAGAARRRASVCEHCWGRRGLWSFR